MVVFLRRPKNQYEGGVSTALVPLYIRTSRTVARKSSIGGFYICASELDIVKIDKMSLIYSVSYFNLGGLELRG